MNGPSPLVDTHAHLDDPRLRDQIDAVLGRALAAGVVQVVAIGTTAVDSAAVCRMAATRPGVFAAVGIHPNELADEQPGDWDKVVALARRPRVVAIGETGLDRYRDRTPFDLQRAGFARHLQLARELDLALVIHCRESAVDILDELARFGGPIRGVLHSFTGDLTQADTFLDFGLHLSFAGMITFANRSLDALREVAARVPIDRLLVETDSPYLAPHPHRGTTNEPARVAHTAARLAELRSLPLDEFAEATTANARRLFGLDPFNQIQDHPGQTRPRSPDRHHR